MGGATRPRMVATDLVRWIDTRRHLALSRARFDHRVYRRELIERGDGFELYLMSWLPGQATEIHDHGGAVTACEILLGALREERFVTRGTHAVPIGEDICTPGVVDVHGAELVHRISALEPTISLLLYLPGAAECRTFEREVAA